jgi:hypothetical protein
MSAIAVPGVTGRIDAEEWSALHRYWLDDEPTGHEYGGEGGYAVFVSHFWGLEQELPDPLVNPPAAEDDLRGRAASLAAETPHVAAAPALRPRLSGNLAEDVHEVCGLTWRQIADIFGISERAVAGWRVQGVPAHRAQTMEALRAIGAILVGGLGPDGVCAWLTAGRRSRIERLRNGELATIAEEADSYRDTPAT